MLINCELFEGDHSHKVHLFPSVLVDFYSIASDWFQPQFYIQLLYEPNSHRENLLELQGFYLHYREPVFKTGGSPRGPCSNLNEIAVQCMLPLMI